MTDRWRLGLVWRTATSLLYSPEGALCQFNDILVHTPVSGGHSEPLINLTWTGTKATLQMVGTELNRRQDIPWIGVSNIMS